MIKKERFKYSTTFLEDELYILGKAPKECTQEIRDELQEAIKVLKNYGAEYHFNKFGI
jgi:hypothetical protein